MFADLKIICDFCYSRWVHTWKNKIIIIKKNSNRKTMLFQSLHCAMSICMKYILDNTFQPLWAQIQYNLIQRCHLTSIGNPIVKIRQSYDRLISTMEFPILVRRHLYIESGRWCLNLNISDKNVNAMAADALALSVTRTSAEWHWLYWLYTDYI